MATVKAHLIPEMKISEESEKQDTRNGNVNVATIDAPYLFAQHSIRKTTMFRLLRDIWREVAMTKI